LKLAESIASVQEGKVQSRADKHHQSQVCVMFKSRIRDYESSYPLLRAHKLGLIVY